MRRERYSMDKTKRSGEKGSPYLRPLLPSKVPWTCPLRWIVNLTVVTQVTIHVIKTLGNFKAMTSSSKKLQWME